MATVIKELVSSRRAQWGRDRSSYIEWHLRVVGPDILDDVIAATELVWPAAVYEPSIDLWLGPDKTTYAPLGPGHKPTDPAQAVWDCVRTYVDPARADDTHELAVGDCRISGSTQGGTARILVSLETVNSYARPGETAPDFKQAVNVTRDNEVKGVDKVVPACKFTVETRLPQGASSGNPTLLTLEAMTSRYNNALWWGRAAGEVLFLGGDMTIGSKSPPVYSLNFLRIPNITGLMLGDIGPIAKLGHHYLWVLFEETPEAASNYMPAVPKAVYVERIYEPGNFATLPLPVTDPGIFTWPF